MISLLLHWFIILVANAQISITDDIMQSLLANFRQQNMDMLLIGDSTDRFLVATVCEYACQKMTPLHGCKNIFPGKKGFVERNKMTIGGCSCAQTGMNLIMFVHHCGVTFDDPQAICKDYDCNGVPKKTNERVLDGLSFFEKFRFEGKPRSPSYKSSEVRKALVTFQSSFWDANANFLRSTEGKGAVLNHTALSKQWYEHFVPLAKTLRDRLNTTAGNTRRQLLLRTHHITEGKYAEQIPIEDIRLLDSLLPEISEQLGIPIFPWGEVVDSIIKKYHLQHWTHEGIHQTNEVSWGVFAELLRHWNQS